MFFFNHLPEQIRIDVLVLDDVEHSAFNDGEHVIPDSLGNSAQSHLIGIVFTANRLRTEPARVTILANVAAGLGGGVRS